MDFELRKVFEALLEKQRTEELNDSELEFIRFYNHLEEFEAGIL